jgi:hypothetical protein
MALVDLLSGLGNAVKTGAKAVGSVAGPVLERTAEVVSGEAPELDRERRQKSDTLEMAGIEAKANEIENQLQMGRQYGTLTAEQQGQLVDQLSALYAHPSQAPNLMNRLHRIVHPKGTTYQAPAPVVPNATPPGGTKAADEKTRLSFLQQENAVNADSDRQQAVKTADFLVSQLPPGISKEQVNAYRNNAIEHLLHVSTGAEKPPKGLKAMEQGGVFFGIEDQDTGKQYLRAQLEPGGDAPPEAKAMYQSVQKAAADKEAAADKKEKEINDRQERQFAHSMEMLRLGLQRSFDLGEIRDAQKQVAEVKKQYYNAYGLVRDMQRNAPAAKGGDQQAMIALLTDHAGGTAKLAGGRLTKPIMDELQNSLPWLDKVRKSWNVGPDGVQYLTGITLSPTQVDQMIAASSARVSALKDTIDQVEADNADVLTPPSDRGTGAKPVKNLKQSMTGAKPAYQVGQKVKLKNGQTVTVSHVYPDGSFD